MDETDEQGLAEPLPKPAKHASEPPCRHRGDARLVGTHHERLRSRPSPLQAATAGILADAYTDASIAEATSAEGFSVVFDATGNAQSMEHGFDFVAHAGRYVLVSVVKTPIAFSDVDFHRKEMTLLGSRNAPIADFETVIAAIRTGLIPVGALVTHRTTLGQAARDLPQWTSAKSGLIKALIEVD